MGDRRDFRDGENLELGSCTGHRELEEEGLEARSQKKGLGSWGKSLGLGLRLRC